MTEEEWLASTDLMSMLDLLRNANHRKLRLFLCACCHLVWDMLCEDSKNAVLVAERFADNTANWSELNKAHNVATDVFDAAAMDREDMTGGQKYLAALMVHTTTFTDLKFVLEFGKLKVVADLGSNLTGQLLRDIFGNPFRPITDIFGNPIHLVSLDPSWLTSTVIALANGIYEERAFDRMPILADALQDAGCDNDEILNHCRGEGVHVRGCWCVDRILGKE